MRFNKFSIKLKTTGNKKNIKLKDRKQNSIKLKTTANKTASN